MESDCQNKLYFGDNLEILRDHVGEESVDLICLDPVLIYSASGRMTNTFCNPPALPIIAREAHYHSIHKIGGIRK